MSELEHGCGRPEPFVCGRCYDEVAELFPATCDEKPETWTSALGQYHCPDCGAMLLAGAKHVSVCKPCLERKHPTMDAP